MTAAVALLAVSERVAPKFLELEPLVVKRETVPKKFFPNPQLLELLLP